MANDEHVAILKKGVKAWNAWRNKNPNIRPDLARAKLRGAKLKEANLSGADLNRVDLIRANLTEANLSRANLLKADLIGANLSRAKLIKADLSEAGLSRAKLIKADLFEADLGGAYLMEANLTEANLSHANLLQAALIGANLSRANLTKANLSDASLSEAWLTAAILDGANLTQANMEGADLRGASLYQTMFGNTTLSKVKGLKQCRHSGPSFVDFQTLKNSGLFPQRLAFLRGIGLPDKLIDYLPSLLHEAMHYSCFISYSSKDDAFAKRLHADLQNKGVRCWFAPHDLPIGAKIIDAIDEAIRLRDKVLLILSKGAIASDWVEGEVTRALDEERTRKQVVLFPVRLDDAVMQTSEGWARLLRGQRNIGDFTGWKAHHTYEKSFDRLMRDLRVKQDSSDAPETR